MHVIAIIAAGGRGRRIGADVPKQFLEIGGRPMLARSVDILVSTPRIHEIVVVVPPDVASAPPGYLHSAGKPLLIVGGGRRRQDSVANGFDQVAARADLIVVHDAARPFVSVALVERTIDAALESGAAVAAVAVRDTVKQAAPASGASERRDVARTLPRDSIYLAQTPQAFRTDVLRHALSFGGDCEATDEAMLAEQAGHRVTLVEGDPQNVKITTAEDLAWARRRLDAGGANGAAVQMRIGTGYDLHRLVQGRPLVLGGVVIPFDRGLMGHSDADAVCHAVTDAILGAAHAGDLGLHFPDTEPRWKDASSLDLLRRAAGLVRAAGFVVENVDVVVIAEQPKLWPYAERMAINLAAAAGIAVDQISIKGKTNEGIGEIGRGEAIAVHAVALARRAV